MATEYEKDCGQDDNPENDLIATEDETKLSFEHGQQPELLQGILPPSPTISPAKNLEVCMHYLYLFGPAEKQFLFF